MSEKWYRCRKKNRRMPKWVSRRLFFHCFCYANENKIIMTQSKHVILTFEFHGVQPSHAARENTPRSEIALSEWTCLQFSLFVDSYKAQSLRDEICFEKWHKTEQRTVHGCVAICKWVKTSVCYLWPLRYCDDGSNNPTTSQAGIQNWPSGSYVISPILFVWNPAGVPGNVLNSCCLAK
jgi:hypothetical protein